MCLKKRVVRARWVVHAIFRCERCGCEFENHETAETEAERHAISEGHVVRGAVGLAVVFYGTV